MGSVSEHVLGALIGGCRRVTDGHRYPFLYTRVLARYGIRAA